MLFGAVGCENLGDDTGAGDSSDAVITVSPSTITATLAGDEKELTVTSNAAWVVSLSDETVEGVTIDPMVGTGDGTVKVTIAESATDRTFSIKFTATKMTEQFGMAVPSVAEAEVAVYQNATGTDKVDTNVKAVRDLLNAIPNIPNGGSSAASISVTEEIAAMTLTGVVVGTPNGNMGSDYLLAVQDDSTEAGHGLTISCSGSVADVAKGQVVKVSLEGAKVKLYYNLLQLSVYQPIEKVGAPVAVEPVEVAYADILSYESQYVKVTDKVTPASTAVGKAWNSGTSGVNVNFTTEAGKTLVVRVGKDASFKSEIVPAKSGYLCGVASRYNNDVQLMPQYTSDILLSENASELESTVVTIAEITEAGTYKVENAWVVGYTGNGPILTDESGAFINTYIYGSTYKTLGQKVTVEGNVSVRQGGFQFNTPTITALEGTVDVVYPTPTSYEGAELAAFCDKYAASGAAYLCEYVELKGVLTKVDTGHYGLAFSGVDASKYDGSLSKTPAAELNLDNLIGSPVVLRGFVTDYSLPYLSITATSVEVDATAAGIFAEAITGVPAEGVTGATHNITVVGVDAVNAEFDGTVVTAASVSGNVLTYSVSANTDKAREGWIKLSAEGVETVTIAVKQSSALAYNFMSDDAFVCSDNDSTLKNDVATAKVNGSAEANGFKVGTGSLTGYFASKAVGVEGDVTLEFYAVAWKGKSATLYVRKQGSTELLGQFTLKANDGATGNPPYTAITLADSDYYTVNIPGVTANTVLEFSTSSNFTVDTNNSSGRAIVVGVHLVGGTPATPDTPAEPEQPETPVTPTVKNLPYEETFAASLGDFTVNDVNQGSLGKSIWYYYANHTCACANGYNGGGTESWLVSPQIDMTSATAPVLTFSHAVGYLNDNAFADYCTLYVKEATAEEWTALTIPNTPTSFTSVDSGEIDLSAYVGKTIQVAFKYFSTASVAVSWQIKNFKVAEKSTATEPEQPIVGGKEVTVAYDQASGNTATSITRTVDGITIVIDKNTAANSPNEHKDGHVRVMGGNTITITGGTIKKVVMTCTSANYVKTFSANTGAVTNTNNIIEWTGETTELVLTNTESAQARVATIKVIYTE